MKTVWNVLLSLTAAACALALLFQGFAFTALSPQLMLWLKILGTVCFQWFFLRISRKKVVQAIPLMVSGIVAVWGYFLYLTSPSWLHATFRHFLSDYALYALICLGVMVIKWLIPRIWRAVRKAIRERGMKKKETTPPPEGYAKKKKIKKGAK